MDFGVDNTPVDVIEEGSFERNYFLKTFILVLMRSGTKSHGKSLISSKILIRSIMAQVL